MVAALSVLGAVGALGGLGAPGAGASAGSTSTPHAKVVLPHYTIRTIAVDNDGSTGRAIVSQNGKYLVNNGVDPYIYNTRTGKLIGHINDIETDARGVSNDGSVFGITFSDGHGKVKPGGQATAFKWRSGHRTLIEPDSSFEACNPTYQQTEFEGASPSGVGVGLQSWLCDDGQHEVAINWSEGKLRVVGRNGPAGTHAGSAFALTAGGLEFADGDGGPQVEWRGTNAPRTVRSVTGLPNVAMIDSGRFVNSRGDFVGDDADTKGTLELIVGTRFYDLPSSTSLFTASSLGDNDIVVGSDENGSVAKVWSPTFGLKSLKSLSTNKTGIHLEDALAMDEYGDIYGTGRKGDAKSYYFEADVTPPAPAVTITTPRSGHTYVKGAMVKASYTCEAPSGHTIKSCKGSVADHAKISTKKTGKHSFTVVATDTDGGTTKKTVHYSVRK